MNSCGSRGIPWRSPNCRATSLPAVTSTVPTNAPVTVRIPPTTSIARRRTPTSSVYCVGLVLPTACTRRAPARPTIATLSTHADHRGQKRSIPIAGAAISSSRVAMAKRPVRVSRNRLTTTSVASTASHSHVSVPWRGTPESPPAPRVNSCQFLTPWSTTNSTARVIIVAASPPARATATPTTAPNTTATTIPTTVAATGPSSTSPIPNGRSGSDDAFVVTGIAASAVPYAASWANARCPNDRIPVDPVNACSPSTSTRLISSSWTRRSRAAPPDEV